MEKGCKKGRKQEREKEEKLENPRSKGSLHDLVFRLQQDFTLTKDSEKQSRRVVGAIEFSILTATPRLIVFIRKSNESEGEKKSEDQTSRKKTSKSILFAKNNNRFNKTSPSSSTDCIGYSKQGSKRRNRTR